MFFFNLFWPALPESKLWSRIKYAGSVFATICVFAAALASTIVVATHSAYLIPAPGQSESLSALYPHPKPPFKYSSYAYNIGWIVLMWIGWVFTALRFVSVQSSSVMLLILFSQHVLRFQGSAISSRQSPPRNHISRSA